LLVGTYCRVEQGSPDVHQECSINPQKEEQMNRYLIETPHSTEECLDLIKVLNAQGYLWNFEWGCKAGIHTGWAIIEAENAAQARLVVPLYVDIGVNDRDTTWEKPHTWKKSTEAAPSIYDPRQPIPATLGPRSETGRVRRWLRMTCAGATTATPKKSRRSTQNTWRRDKSH
jgi:hypothetical protein